MANTFRKVYKKTGNSGTSSDYQLVGNIGVNGVELDIMKGATSSADGEIGLVPKPKSGDEDCILTGNATWNSIDNILKKSEDTPIIRSGSLVYTNKSGGNITEKVIFTPDDLNRILGVSDSNVDNTTVIFVNGDGNAGLSRKTIMTVGISGSDSWKFVITDGSAIPNNSKYRINYIACYFNKEKYTEYDKV